jgi:hypothetical protein
MTVLLIATTAELILVSGTTSPTVPWPLLINPPSTINKLPDNVKQRQARIISIRKQGDTGKYLTNPATNANDQVRAEQRALLVPLVHDQFNIAGVEWPASLDLSAESLAVSSLRSSDSYNITDIEGARSMNIESVLSPSNSKNDAVNIENIGAFPRASLITKDGEIPAEYTEMSPTKIQIKSSATTTSLLVVRDSWYPGWQTYIDGQKVTTNVYENIFRSASVPAGVHTITMEYVPYSMYIGVAISLIAVTIITLSVGSYLIR